MKPRLGKKGRKALAAKKAAKRAPKKRAAKPQAPAPEPQAAPEPPSLTGPPYMPGDTDYVAPSEESGVGDECCVGGVGGSQA